MKREIGGFVPCGLPCAGFTESGVASAPGYIAPVCLRAIAPEGRYRVRATLRAEEDAPTALLFGNHRRLLWRGALRKGERKTVSALCALHPALPEGADEPAPGEAIELALVAPGAAIVAVSAEPADAPAVLLLGDSTVTDQPSFSPYAPGACYAGWGQMLPCFLGESACVVNLARSGMTAETFRTEGLYDLLLAQLRPGDVALIQFGHNDQKRPHLTARGGYARLLKAYVRELTARGARVAVVTPLARNSWRDERTYFDLLGPFASAAKRVARETGAPAIDLHAFQVARLRRDGRDACKPLYRKGDYTHTNDFGAYLAAGFVAGELSRLSLADARAQEPWTPAEPLEPIVPVSIDEATPPMGLEALYLGYERTRPDAPLTRIEALELVNRTVGLFATNAPAPLPPDVPQSESWTCEARCALQSGLLPEGFLREGKLRPHRAITRREFLQLLRKGFAMRCAADALPDPDAAQGGVSRAEAAALCRSVRI